MEKFLLKGIFFLFFVTILSASKSFADERHFSFVYESDVLGRGFKEIELYSTPHLGNMLPYYFGYDERLEFEIGVSKNLQGSLYLNFDSFTSDDGMGNKLSQTRFRGISTEWKYQVSKPYGKSLGCALYGELGLSTDEAEIETKLILDKKIGNSKIAANFTGEPEWELSASKTIFEFRFGTDLGFTHFFTKTFAAGIEIRNENIYSNNNGFECSALFAGPVCSYSQPSWFAVISISPQITALKGKSPGSNLELHDHAKFDARLLLSFGL